MLQWHLLDEQSMLQRFAWCTNIFVHKVDVFLHRVERSSSAVNWSLGSLKCNCFNSIKTQNKHLYDIYHKMQFVLIKVHLKITFLNLRTNSSGLIELTLILLMQNGFHFADDIFKCIFMNENVWALIKISLKFVQGSTLRVIRSSNPT